MCGELTFLAALMEVKPNQFVEVLDDVASRLEDFEDFMPSQLPKTLPPRRVVDHKIELKPGALAPSQALTVWDLWS